MRFTSLLLGFCLSLGVLAAEDNNYETYAPKTRSGPLKLNDPLYRKLTKVPRDYSVAVLLTALEAKFGCALCQEFQPEWEILGKSWANGDSKGESRLLFGTLDVANGRETFQSLMLQTAPVMLLFPPTTGPNAKPDGQFIRLDFHGGLNKAEPVHSWISRHLPSVPHPRIVRPINYVKIATTIVSVLGAISLLAVAAPKILPIVQSRNLWAAVSIIAVLLFISGHVFNHIRHMPYVGNDGRGGVNYFRPSPQEQFGLESQIVAAIYGVLSFATIALALKVPRISDPRSQRIAIYAWSAVVLLVYSVLLSIFRIKHGGYPFWLPPF